jgi:hypothetical protein
MPVLHSQKKSAWSEQLAAAAKPQPAHWHSHLKRAAEQDDTEMPRLHCSKIFNATHARRHRQNSLSFTRITANTGFDIDLVRFDINWLLIKCILLAHKGSTSLPRVHCWTRWGWKATCASFRSKVFSTLAAVALSFCIWQLVFNYKLIRIKKFVSWFTTKLCN